ncbi:MAG: hypothetical protein WCV62_00915 [Candidatus Peribacteraceae bacterium]|jgi:hypothetical protein
MATRTRIAAEDARRKLEARIELMLEEAQDRWNALETVPTERAEGREEFRMKVEELHEHLASVQEDLQHLHELNSEEALSEE